MDHHTECFLARYLPDIEKIVGTFSYQERTELRLLADIQNTRIFLADIKNREAKDLNNKIFQPSTAIEHGGYDSNSWRIDRLTSTVNDLKSLIQSESRSFSKDGGLPKETTRPRPSGFFMDEKAYIDTRLAQIERESKYSFQHREYGRSKETQTADIFHTLRLKDVETQTSTPNVPKLFETIRIRDVETQTTSLGISRIVSIGKDENTQTSTLDFPIHSHTIRLKDTETQTLSAGGPKNNRSKDVQTQTVTSTASRPKDGETQTDNFGYPRSIDAVMLKDFLKRTAQAIHHPVIHAQDYLSACLDELDNMCSEIPACQTNQNLENQSFADVIRSVLFPVLSVLRTQQSNHRLILTHELGGRQEAASPVNPQCSCGARQSSPAVPKPITVQAEQSTTAVWEPEQKKTQGIVKPGPSVDTKHLQVNAAPEVERCFLSTASACHENDAMENSSMQNGKENIELKANIVDVPNDQVDGDGWDSDECESPGVDKEPIQLPVVPALDFKVFTEEETRVDPNEYTDQAIVCHRSDTYLDESTDLFKGVAKTDLITSMSSSDTNSIYDFGSDSESTDWETNSNEEWSIISQPQDGTNTEDVRAKVINKCISDIVSHYIGIEAEQSDSSVIDDNNEGELVTTPRSTGGDQYCSDSVNDDYSESFLSEIESDLDSKSDESLSMETNKEEPDVRCMVSPVTGEEIFLDLSTLDDIADDEVKKQPVLKSPRVRDAYLDIGSAKQLAVITNDILDKEISVMMQEIPRQTMTTYANLAHKIVRGGESCDGVTLRSDTLAKEVTAITNDILDEEITEIVQELPKHTMPEHTNQTEKAVTNEEICTEVISRKENLEKEEITISDDKDTTKKIQECMKHEVYTNEELVKIGQVLTEVGKRETSKDINNGIKVKEAFCGSEDFWDMGILNRRESPESVAKEEATNKEATKVYTNEELTKTTQLPTEVGDKHGRPISLEVLSEKKNKETPRDIDSEIEVEEASCASEDFWDMGISNKRECPEAMAKEIDTNADDKETTKVYTNEELVKTEEGDKHDRPISPEVLSEKKKIETPRDYDSEIEVEEASCASEDFWDMGISKRRESLASIAKEIDIIADDKETTKVYTNEELTKTTQLPTEVGDKHGRPISPEVLSEKKKIETPRDIDIEIEVEEASCASEDFWDMGISKRRESPASIAKEIDIIADDKETTKVYTNEELTKTTQLPTEVGDKHGRPISLEVLSEKKKIETPRDIDSEIEVEEASCASEDFWDMGISNKRESPELNKTESRSLPECKVQMVANNESGDQTKPYKVTGNETSTKQELAIDTFANKNLEKPILPQGKVQTDQTADCGVQPNDVTVPGQSTTEPDARGEEEYHSVPLSVEQEQPSSMDSSDFWDQERVVYGKNSKMTPPRAASLSRSDNGKGHDSYQSSLSSDDSRSDRSYSRSSSSYTSYDSRRSDKKRYSSSDDSDSSSYTSRSSRSSTRDRRKKYSKRRGSSSDSTSRSNGSKSSFSSKSSEKRTYSSSYSSSSDDEYSRNANKSKKSVSHNDPRNHVPIQSEKEQGPVVKNQHDSTRDGDEEKIYDIIDHCGKKREVKETKSESIKEEHAEEKKCRSDIAEDKSSNNSITGEVDPVSIESRASQQSISTESNIDIGSAPCRKDKDDNKLSDHETVNSKSASRTESVPPTQLNSEGSAKTRTDHSKSVHEHHKSDHSETKVALWLQLDKEDGVKSKSGCEVSIGAEEKSTGSAKYGRRSQVRKSCERNGEDLDWLKPLNDKPKQVAAETKVQESKPDNSTSIENKISKMKTTIEKEKPNEDNKHEKNETSTPKTTESDPRKSAPLVDDKLNTKNKSNIWTKMMAKYDAPGKLETDAKNKKWTKQRNPLNNVSDSDRSLTESGSDTNTKKPGKAPFKALAINESYIVKSPCDSEPFELPDYSGTLLPTEDNDDEIDKLLNEMGNKKSNKPKDSAKKSEYTSTKSYSHVSLPSINTTKASTNLTLNVEQTNIVKEDKQAFGVNTKPNTGAESDNLGHGKKKTFSGSGIFTEDVKPSYSKNKQKLSKISADNGVDDLDDLLDEIDSLANNVPDKRASSARYYRTGVTKDKPDGRTGSTNGLRDGTEILADVKLCKDQTENTTNSDGAQSNAKLKTNEVNKPMKSNNEEVSSPKNDGNQNDEKSDSIIEEVFDEMSDDNECPKPLDLNETNDTAQCDKVSRKDDKEKCDRKHDKDNGVSSSDPQACRNTNDTHHLAKASKQKHNEPKNSEVQKHEDTFKSLNPLADNINIPKLGYALTDKSLEKKQEVSDRDQTVPGTSGISKETSVLLLNPLLRRGSTLTPLAPIEDLHKKKNLKKKKKSDGERKTSKEDKELEENKKIEEEKQKRREERKHKKEKAKKTDDDKPDSNGKKEEAGKADKKAKKKKRHHDYPREDSTSDGFEMPSFELAEDVW